MPPAEDWADALRTHFKRARVDRAELFENTPTHKHITLHDLRSTGITWRCLRRDYGPEIQQAAGHEKDDTTDEYIRTARVFIGRLGEPFPALRPDVIRSQNRSRDTQVVDFIASPTGFETLLTGRLAGESVCFPMRLVA